MAVATRAARMLVVALALLPGAAGADEKEEERTNSHLKHRHRHRHRNRLREALAQLQTEGSWTPGLSGRRGGAGGLPHQMLTPLMNYGTMGPAVKRRFEEKEQEKPPAEPADQAPFRHRLVVCNAYRSEGHLAAIHKRPGRAAIPAAWAGDYVASKTLIPGIPFKMCDVSRMEFREGDSIVFKIGGTDVGSFNSSGALGLSAGKEVSLVVVPFRKLGHREQSAQFVSHVFRTPKQKVGSQVILADTLKTLSPGDLKMEDRSGRLWPVHDDQEVTLQAGAYHFSALDKKGANLSSTPLMVAAANSSANANAGKYLVLRIEADPDSAARDMQEFVTFTLPTPTISHSTPEPVTKVEPTSPPRRAEDAPPTVTVGPFNEDGEVQLAALDRRDAADDTLSAAQVGIRGVKSGAPAARAAGLALLLAAGACSF